MTIRHLQANQNIDSESMGGVREAAENITAVYDRAYYLKCIEDDRVPTELLKALADTGLLGIGLPEEFGGNGGGITEELVLKETLSMAGLVLPYLVIPNFTRRVVAKYGSAEQREQWIPRTLNGEDITCFALTEAESGTNAFAMRTRAQKRDDGWLVNGEKVYISGAAAASQMMLVARTGTSPSGRAELSMFLLDLPHPGVSMTQMRTNATLPEHQYVVSFDDVLLPPETLLGKEGEAAQSMFFALNPERILGAAGAIGIGLHVLERGVEYTKTRAPFEVPTGSYQSVQHPLARAYAHLQAARSITYAAAAGFDRGENSGVAANTANYLASEAGYAAYDAAFQTFGGAAFDRDSDIITFYETVRLQRVAPLNNESLLSFIAEKGLGLPRSSS